MSDDNDRTVTLKLPKNPFKRNRSGDGDNSDKKHKRHVLLWLVVIYLVIKNVVDTFQTNATLEGIVKATKMDRSAFKDVDYKVDYIMNPFSLFGGLFGDIDVTTGLLLLLVAVVLILLVIVIKQNNNKKDEDHS